MKYIIDVTKHLSGEIEIYATSRQEAKEKALSESNRHKIKWRNNEYFTIDEVYCIPTKCDVCNATLPEGSVYCNKCGAKCQNEEVDLGRVFSVHFDKPCQTTWLFDKFYGQEKYDTLFMKNFFYICKSVVENNQTKEISSSVSFYIKCFPLNNNSEILKDNRTISTIKNKYCEKVIYSDKNSKDSILSSISKLFINNKFDSNGDAFFKKAISFKAKDSFGVTSTYYLVGVNFK